MRTSERTSGPARTVKAAARVRRKHERVIDEQPDAVRRLRRAISWLLAELKRRPDLIDEATGWVMGLAADLNERSAR